MMFDQITIIGVGLIGGSVGLAAKGRGLATRVVGVGRDRAKLARAAELGAVDSFTTEMNEGVAAAGLVAVCTPVDRIGADILRAAPHWRQAEGGLLRFPGTCGNRESPEIRV
jgi:prephenate dehydrogenase